MAHAFEVAHDDVLPAVGAEDPSEARPLQGAVGQQPEQTHFHFGGA